MKGNCDDNYGVDVGFMIAFSCVAHCNCISCFCLMSLLPFKSYKFQFDQPTGSLLFVQLRLILVEVCLSQKPLTQHLHVC